MAPSYTCSLCSNTELTALSQHASYPRHRRCGARDICLAVWLAPAQTSKCRVTPTVLKLSWFAPKGPNLLLDNATSFHKQFRSHLPRHRLGGRGKPEPPYRRNRNSDRGSVLESLNGIRPWSPFGVVFMPLSISWSDVVGERVGRLNRRSPRTSTAAVRSIPAKRSRQSRHVP